MAGPPATDLRLGAQVVSGALLTVHMVAQHFVARQGLRSYAEVVAWIRNPVVFASRRCCW